MNESYNSHYVGQILFDSREEVTLNPRHLSYVSLIRATSITFRITARFIQPTLSPSATSALRSCYLPVESLTRNLISDL